VANAIPLMLASVFLMSTHSAFFGPSKYGLLPELLPEKKLSWGNGMFGFGTFAAIIAGTIFAGTLSDTFGKKSSSASGVDPHRAGIDRAALACASSAFPPPIRGKNSAQIFSAIFFADETDPADRILFLGVVGNAFLWFLGALLAADNPFLRQGNFAFGRHAQRLAANLAGHRHRRGQFCGRIFVRQKIEYG
jgi:acyl-[acyl-carrier-protein]-phospholipid O-acyltransferase/long-chain-fatty-acid--[acyl-carrier-protein] ligase